MQSSVGVLDLDARPDPMSFLDRIDANRTPVITYGALPSASSEDIRGAIATFESIRCGCHATLGEMREALETLPHEAAHIAMLAEVRTLPCTAATRAEVMAFDASTATIAEIQANRAKMEAHIRHLLGR